MPTTHPTYTNEEIAELLENVATAYEIKKKNFFRIVSYKNAADAISTYPKSVFELWQEDKSSLDRIPNVGSGIQEKLDYLFSKNKYHPHIRRAFKNIHPAVFAFTKVNGIGPKIAYKLTQAFKFPKRDPLKALEKLIRIAQKGKIRTLPTFGQKSEESILENTQNYLGRKAKMSYIEANAIANDIISFLKARFPDVEFEPLGSLRRHAPLVGDIDIAAKSTQAQDIINTFIQYPKNVKTLIKGPKKASIRLYHDIRADLMVQSDKTWGSLLQHFTGSKMHNIKLRKYAESLGYSLSEYGIKDLRTSEIRTFSSENDFYNFLGLNYIQPQDRLGEDEIEKAKKGV